MRKTADLRRHPAAGRMAHDACASGSAGWAGWSPEPRGMRSNPSRVLHQREGRIGGTYSHRHRPRSCLPPQPRECRKRRLLLVEGGGLALLSRSRFPKDCGRRVQRGMAPHQEGARPSITGEGRRALASSKQSRRAIHPPKRKPSGDLQGQPLAKRCRGDLSSHSPPKWEPG